MMSRFHPALAGVSLLLAAPPVRAEDAGPSGDVVVTARKAADAPASTASVDAGRIAATINAANVEDALRYLPSLIVRKRHIGDTQAPVATRTGGLGASARSLVYADGALLSALIGNNNTNASPRWSLVAPEEIERIDVAYGPFSAAYPGNAIGAVIAITTRTPDHLEASATLGVSAGRFAQYETRQVLPAYQAGAWIGDRVGRLAWSASWDRVTSDSQPLLYVTAARPASASTAGTPATGGVEALSRTGGAIRVLGASGIEHQRQDRARLKTTLDLAPGVTLGWTGALFANNTDAEAESYLHTTAGPVYAGTLNLDGRAYPVAASAFSGGVYRQRQHHWSNAVSLAGSGKAIDWRLIATRYAYGSDTQRAPTTALPAARGGGAGTILRLDGTGWTTLDASLGWRRGGNQLSVGGHADWVELNSRRFVTADWLRGVEGAADLVAQGRTRTAALWAEDAWTALPRVTLTLGARAEWWRADRGRNIVAASRIDTVQPVREAARLSPKATLAYGFASGWTARISGARAWRFPTVGELYQVVTTPVPSVPNPSLRPERALSSELAIERADAQGTARVSLFAESIRDALVSQTGLLTGTTQLGTYVQNVARTRAHGVEAAADRRDVLPRIDLSGSVTWSDTIVAANPALPTSVGRQLPGVPQWKATLVGTWRPTDDISLTAAGRYASRIWGTLDHSDTVTYTYQGFGSFLVADARAQVKAGAHAVFGLGIDNLFDRRYFLFHPFPQRTVRADLTMRL